jgi:hypothetical protein
MGECPVLSTQAGAMKEGIIWTKLMNNKEADAAWNE